MKILRPRYIEALKNRMNNGLIKVVTGIRRCGKSYLLFNLFVDFLKSTGVSDDCIIELRKNDIPFNYIDINKYIIINCYCATQKDSTIVKEILDKYNAKYFVSESKIL